MSDLDIRGLTDHELLVMIVQKFNDHCETDNKTIGKHERTLFNGGFGIVFQVKALWLLAGGGWAIALALIAAGKFHL